MVGFQPGISAKCHSLSDRMPAMAWSMPSEARCQEERGINFELCYSGLCFVFLDHRTIVDIHLKVFPTSRPLFIMFYQQSSYEPDCGCFIWKYSNDSFSSSDFLVQSFDTICEYLPLMRAVVTLVFYQVCFLKNVFGIFASLNLEIVFELLLRVLYGYRMLSILVI